MLPLTATARTAPGSPGSTTSTARVPPRGAAPRVVPRDGGTVHGYLRAGTDGDRGVLVRAGATVLHVERGADVPGPGAELAQPALALLVGSLRPGDTVVVASLEQLAPTVARVVRWVSTLAASGVTLRSVRDGVDTSTPGGRAVVAAFRTLADYDRRLAYPPTVPAAQRSGRPPSLTATQVQWAGQRRGAGASVREVAAQLGVGQSTLYRALAGAGRG